MNENAISIMWRPAFKSKQHKDPLDILPKDTRGKVTLTPEAFKALEIEAMLQGISLKDAASKLRSRWR